MTKENKLHHLSVRIPLHQLNVLEREEYNTGNSISKTIRLMIDKHIESN